MRPGAEGEVGEGLPVLQRHQGRLGRAQPQRKGRRRRRQIAARCNAAEWAMRGQPVQQGPAGGIAVIRVGTAASAVSSATSVPPPIATIAFDKVGANTSPKTANQVAIQRALM